MSKRIFRGSIQLYSFILKFYPKSYRQEFGEEMKYVFSESLKDAYRTNKERGIIIIWIRTLLDAFKSLFTQYKEKGGETMATKRTDLLMQNKVFGWIALGTGIVLLIPLLGMQMSSDWNWSLSDFVISAVLLFGMGSLFVLAARRVSKHRLILGVLFALAIIYIWAELAVGIFTNWGS